MVPLVVMVPPVLKSQLTEVARLSEKSVGEIVREILNQSKLGRILNGDV